MILKQPDADLPGLVRPSTHRGEAQSEHSFDRLFRPLDAANDGNFGESRRRRLLIPELSGPVDCDIVPNNGGTILFPEQARDQMLLVPILRCSEVGDASERGRGRRPKISRQYRFPDYEYSYIRISLFLEQFFECRGPLQAYRSSRRDQDKQPHRM